MCLIALDWRPGGDAADADDGNVSRKTPFLLLVSNRDEVYDRPSETAHFWGNDDDDDDDDAQLAGAMNIYGGRDLVQGGTWLACSTQGRLAAVTNYHKLEERAQKFPRSRGEIVSKFVKGCGGGGGGGGGSDNGSSKRITAFDFCQNYLYSRRNDYAGFSAFLFDGQSLVYCTNRDPSNQSCRILPAGVYGLSNHLLDTPWPKLLKAKAVVRVAASSVTARDVVKENEKTDCESISDLPENVIQQLLSAFADTSLVDDRTLLPTTLGPTEEHLRSSLCVRGPGWGTRTTSIVRYHGPTAAASDIGGGVRFEFIEQNFYDTPGNKASFSRQVIQVAGDR